MTQCDINRLATLYETILARPGELTGSSLADAVGINRSYVYKYALHLMNDYGFLLSQDRKSKLYPFGVCGEAESVIEARRSGRLTSGDIVKAETARVVLR